MVGWYFVCLIDFDTAITTIIPITATTRAMTTTEISSDPYELKLYHMFQSCDSDQSGLLDEQALRRLCSLLELRDKGAEIIESLAAADVKKKPCVSFERFKEALLNFLGTELDGSNSGTVANTSYTKLSTQSATTDADKNALILKERSLVIADDVGSFVESPAESSDREVSPKLIVGTKKYGRRSKPSQIVAQPPRKEQNASIDDGVSLSDSENIDGNTNVDVNDDEEAGYNNSCNAYNNNNKLVQRSSSQSDIPGGRRRRPQTFNGSKLKRCSSLPAQRNLQNNSKSATGKIKFPTITKSLQQQKEQQQQLQLSSSVESLDAPTHLDTLPAHSIIEIWKHANIANGRGILLALGFDEPEINLLQLSKVLDEELRHLEDDPQMTFLRAALALQSAELTTLRQTYRQLRDENAKLRADNKDANRRVALLAVEIDERHASLEDTTKKEIRMLEQKHAGVVRDLTARMTNDRENWTNLTARLETRIKIFEQEEIKLKTEVELVNKENNELECEQQKLQKQITELLEKNISLNREIVALEEGTHAERTSRSVEKGTEDELLRLMEKITTLQLENTNLRDKNDELVVELENLNLELTRSKAKNKKTNAALSSTTQESDEIALDSEAEHAGSAAGGANATATKRRGDSPSKAKITEESPRTGKLRKCNNETEGAGSETSDTSGEWMALNSELQATNSAQVNSAQEKHEKVRELKEKINALETQLQAATKDNTGDERCKELETSLEQMQRAYEDCEDYWQRKLSDERALFEKERQIYEDEQLESDKKFTELMEKVREYEEQFSKDGRLSPIEEKDVLEQQYVELEAEAEEIRENSRRIFEEKSNEIEALQHEIEDLRLRLGESVEILTGANELSTEAAATAADSPNASASSPICYLWHQSTIQEPAKNYESFEKMAVSVVTMAAPQKQTNRNNLSTSEMAIFSTTPIEGGTVSPNSVHSPVHVVAPIQKPTKQIVESEGDVADCDTSSTASGRSFETHSITSTHSAAAAVGVRDHAQHHTATTAKSTSSCTSPSGIKDELKRLKFFEISLKEQIKDLSLQRDGLVMELQQLHEAKPVLEKAYARTAHPSLIQRVNQLELKNRHLQNVIKQQQHYTESLMQQSWRQHQIELNDLHTRIETQGVMLAEQAQRLQNSDILVKDLYVENSHLTATVQRLEQQRARVNLMHQQQQQHQQQQLQQHQQLQRQGLHGLPGIP